MDYYPGSGPGAIDYSPYDLVILHHPPQVIPDIPAYVIHSNWDLIPGGANDALADCLLIKTDDVLDPETGLGRIGTVQDGPIILSRFVRYVMRGLQISSVQIVNYAEERLITRVGVVSGFGLNQNLITIAQSRGIDLFISGDLTHPGAMIAKRSDLVLLDATHHATELPGLKKLGELLSGVGVSVQGKGYRSPYRDIYRLLPAGIISGVDSLRKYQGDLCHFSGRLNCS